MLFRDLEERCVLSLGRLLAMPSDIHCATQHDHSGAACQVARRLGKLEQMQSHPGILAYLGDEDKAELQAILDLALKGATDTEEKALIQKWFDAAELRSAWFLHTEGGTATAADLGLK